MEQTSAIGMWDVVRDLMPVVSTLLMGLVAWLLRRLDKGQAVATDIAKDAKESADVSAANAVIAAQIVANNTITAAQMVANTSKDTANRADSAATSAAAAVKVVAQVAAGVNKLSSTQDEKLNHIRELVNGNHSELVAANAQLVAQLTRMGVVPEVPPAA